MKDMTLHNKEAKQIPSRINSKKIRIYKDRIQIAESQTQRES